jgi:Fe-S-cluster containining protein
MTLPRVALKSAISIKKESMTTKLSEQGVTCANCKAACCRLEAMLFNDSEVPEQYIVTDVRGERSMARLEDGWCSALDRDTLICTIYENRPWICREFEMGGSECLAARAEWL